MIGRAMVPFRNSSFAGLDREFNRVFDGMLAGTPAWSQAASFSPAVDIHEQEDAVIIRADVPGVAREDLEVQVKDGVLTLKGERKTETREENDGLLRMERATGAFTRSFRLGRTLDASSVAATYNNGVLEVRVNKAAEAQPHTVKIK